MRAVANLYSPLFFFFGPFSKSPDFPFSFPSRPPKVTMGTLLFSFHPFSFLSFTSMLLLYVLDVFLEAGWSGPSLGNSWESWRGRGVGLDLRHVVYITPQNSNESEMFHNLANGFSLRG